MSPLDCVCKLIRQSVDFMGEVFVLQYSLPEVADLSRFFNSLSITLSQMALHPQYFWQRTADGCHLVLVVYGGFCRKDTADIHEVVIRLWHDPVPPVLLYWAHADRSSLPYVLSHFYPVPRTVPQTETVSPQPHTRMFGSSQGI